MVADAKRDARARPGQFQFYDGGNGYAFSHLGRVFECYREFVATGVDRLIKEPKAPKAPKAPAPKRAPAPSAPSSPPAKRPAPSTPSAPAKRPAPSAAPISPSLLSEEDTERPMAPPPKKYRPVPPAVDLQDNRMVCSSRALKNYLRNHRDGDWVANPHRKQARAESLSTTKARADDHIKKIITEWALGTREGDRFLQAADLKAGEFTIDRIRSRNGESSGLNCIWNLYFMPARDNSAFGERDGDAKRVYVGETAWKVASDAHARFKKDNEKAYNWLAFEKDVILTMMQ